MYPTPRPAAALLLMGLVTCNRGDAVQLTHGAGSVGILSTGMSAGAAPLTDAAKSRALRRGALIDATTGRSISSRTTTPGETLKATVYSDAVDDIGRVVIPAGSVIELIMTDLTPAGDRSGNDATMRLVITGVTVKGRHYPIDAELKSMYHSLAGRRFLVEEEREAQANSYGVVAARVIGADESGTIVGGAMRAAGAVVPAYQTAGRDVVVLAGTPIVIKLKDPFTLQWR